MKKIICVAFFLGTLISVGQTRYQLELGLGAGFQSKMVLNNQKLNNARTFTLRLGANVQIPIAEKSYFETGLFGKYNRGAKKTETFAFKSNSLRMQMPVYFGYTIIDIWKIALGTSIENNKDFHEIDFRTSKNFRFDFLTKVSYVYSDQFQFSLYSNWLLNNKNPDIYTISNPKNGVLIGVIYQFKKNKL